jgi:HK97 family phage portal protein
MDLLLRLRSNEPRASYAPWDDFWFKPPSAAYGAAGVSPEGALRRLSMVWRCVRAKSFDMASLSLFLYRKIEGGKARAENHPVYYVLHDAPNEFMTPFLFEQLAQTHLCLRGMFFARILEDGLGRVQQLVPMNPDRVTPELLPSGRLRFVHRRVDGGQEILTQNEVHYRTGLSLDGVKGISEIEASAPTLARAMAAETFAQEFFSGGAVPPVALRHPLTLGPEGQDTLRASLAKYRAGDKYLILEEAMEATSIGVNARDAQMLEVQQHNDEQIAGVFGMPPHRVGISKPGSQSYASNEQADIAYVKYVIGAQAKSNEEALTRDLLSARERAFYVVEYMLESLLRGDTAARGTFYKALAEVEAITPNEIRQRENMNPLPGGDDVVKNVPKTPEPSNSPRDPMGRPKGGARAVLIAEEAAARVVQKEIAAATKAATKHANDPKAWQTWCQEFYDDHAGFIAQVLKLPTNEARAYAERQRAALQTKGVPAMTDWDRRATRELTDLALGECA